MAFPSKQEIAKVMARLKRVQPTRIISKNAPLLDRTKFQFCQRIIVFMHDHELSQIELAKRLGIDKSRVNEIVKCRIELFSLDKVIRFAEILELDVRVVAA